MTRGNTNLSKNDSKKINRKSRNKALFKTKLDQLLPKWRKREAPPPPQPFSEEYNPASQIKINKDFRLNDYILNPSQSELLKGGYGRARPKRKEDLSLSNDVPIEKILSAKEEGKGMSPTPQPLMVPPTPQSLTVLPQHQLLGEAYGKALLNKKKENLLSWDHNIPVEKLLSAEKEDLIFANNILIEKEIQQKGEGKGGDKGGSKGGSKGESKGGGKGGGKGGPPPPKAKGAAKGATVRDIRPPVCSELPCFAEIYNQYGLELAMGDDVQGVKNIVKRFDINDTDVPARVESIATDCDSILTDAANIIHAFSIRTNEFNAFDEKSWKAALDFIGQQPITPFKLVPEAIGKFFEVKNPNELLDKFRAKHGKTAFHIDISLVGYEIIRHLIAIGKSDSQTVLFDNLPDSKIDWNEQDLDYMMGFVTQTRKTLSVDQILIAIKRGFEKKVKLCKSNYDKVLKSRREQTSSPYFRRTSTSPYEKKLDDFFELLTDIKTTNLDNVSKQNLTISVSRLGNASAFSVALYAIGSELRKCLSESRIDGDNDFRDVLILLGNALKHVNVKSNTESSDKRNPADVLYLWANFFQLILKEKMGAFTKHVAENKDSKTRPKDLERLEDLEKRMESAKKVGENVGLKMRNQSAHEDLGKKMKSALSVAQRLLEGSKSNYIEEIIDTVYFIRVLIDVYYKSKDSNNYLGICRKVLSMKV
jgi:hypothetical protein